MIYRIITYSLIFDLFIAIFLASIGVHTVSLDNNFMYCLKMIQQTISPYRIEIPKIPALVPFKNASGIILVLNYLMYIVNALSGIINFVIVMLNLIIELLSFIVSLLSAFAMWVDRFGVGRGILAIAVF